MHISLPNAAAIDSDAYAYATQPSFDMLLFAAHAQHDFAQIMLFHRFQRQRGFFERKRLRDANLKLTDAHQSIEVVEQHRVTEGICLLEFHTVGRFGFGHHAVRKGDDAALTHQTQRGLNVVAAHQHQRGIEAVGRKGTGALDNVVAASIHRFIGTQLLDQLHRLRPMQWRKRLHPCA